MSDLNSVPSFVIETSGDTIRVHVSFADGAPADADILLRVTLALHGEIAVHFWADIECRKESDSWVGEFNNPRQAARRLAQLTGILIGEDRQETPLSPETLYWESAQDGEWQAGESAEGERQRLEVAREAMFNQPLKAPGATDDSPRFSVIIAVDNWLSGTAQRIPGMQIRPVNGSTLGTDLIEMLNSVSAQLGFRSGVNPRVALQNIQQTRPAVVLYAPQVLADSAKGASDVSRRTAATLLDLVSLRRGASPRALAGIIGREVSPGVRDMVGFWVEGSGYTGNLVTGYLSGEDPISLLSQWRGISSDGRTRLWLSLYSDALSDERWDYRVFRCFNLLEGIAGEILPAHQQVRDEAGNLLLQVNGNPYTTDQARGKVFELIKHVAQRGNMALSNFATSNSAVPRTLWDETEVWVTIRNGVAHRGSWEFPAGVTISNRDQNIQAEITSLGQDGTFASGAFMVHQTIKRATETVLYAAVNGRL